MKAIGVFKPRLSSVIVDTDLNLGPYSLITRGSVQVKDDAGNVKARLENSGVTAVGHDFVLARTIAGDYQWKRAIVPWFNMFILNFGRDFSGGIITHGGRPFHLFNTDGSVEIVGPIADSVNTLRPSPPIRFRASYWNGAGAADRDLELFTDIDSTGVRYLRIRRREDGYVAGVVDSNGNASFSGTLTVGGKATILGAPQSDTDALRLGDLFNTYMKEVTFTTDTSVTLNTGVETTVISRPIVINKRALVIAVFYGLVQGSTSSVVYLMIKEGSNILGLSSSTFFATNTDRRVGVMGAKLFDPGTYSISVIAKSDLNPNTMSPGAFLRIIILGV